MRTADDITLCLRALESAGVEIRTEAADAAGGLARLQGRYIFLVNSRASPDKTLENCIAALRKFDIDTLRLPPRVRSLLGDSDW